MSDVIRKSGVNRNIKAPRVECQIQRIIKINIQKMAYLSI